MPPSLEPDPRNDRDQPDASGLRVLDGALTTLQLAPGDIVVFMMDRNISSEAELCLIESLKVFVPGHQVMVLQEGCRLGAISPAPTIPELSNAETQRLYKEWSAEES